MSKERQPHEYNNEINELKARIEVYLRTNNDLSKEVIQLTQALAVSKRGGHMAQQRSETYKAALIDYSSIATDVGHLARVALGRTCTTCKRGQLQGTKKAMSCNFRRFKHQPSCRRWELYEREGGQYGAND